MGNTNASITWNNVIGVGGAAVLTIRYGTHITNVVKGLYVNGVRVASVSLPATGAFTIYSTQPVNVTLNSGANTVAIVNDSASTGAVNIDKVDVQ
jgi:Carbohydrate binding module (family 35)